LRRYIKVKAEPDTRSGLLQLAKIFRASVVGPAAIR
jgi:acetolactate synthase small subunit